MNTSDYSTFQQLRPISSNAIGPPHVAEVPYDLITFLAVAQRLQIEILPMTWQPEKQRIGSGATSQIAQSLINLQTSFAFKRVALQHRLRESEDSIYGELISELMVLYNPYVRRHPNMAELQGICWDTPATTVIETTAQTVYSTLPVEDKVWPVLIFEKSQFGDLLHFARQPAGRSLTMEERMSICADIGTAIADMHDYHMIHGDIKPHNVLVFKDDADKFTARVTDFGYSTCYADEDDLVQLPRSYPWYAPEHDRLACSTDRARKMDIFSYGLLCLWLVFEPYFSSPDLVGRYSQAKSIGANNVRLDMWDVLEDLKQKNELARFARQLLANAQELESDAQLGLTELFDGSLDVNPDSRVTNLRDCVKSLGWAKSKSLQIDTSHHQDLSDCDFRMVPMMRAFYRSDHHVRDCITKCIERRVQALPTRSLILQLALCLELGSGCDRDDSRAHELLQKNDMSTRDLEDSFERIAVPTRTPTAGSKFRAVKVTGQLTRMLYHERYPNLNALEVAEAAVRKDVDAFEHGLGPEHHLTLVLKGDLASILLGRGQLHDAEALLSQVCRGYERTLGLELGSASNMMRDLGELYFERGEWEKAEKLNKRILETRLRTSGEEDISTLSTMANLSLVQWEQGRQEEAVTQMARVMDKRLEIYGVEHAATLQVMANLATMYVDQGKLAEAEELASRVTNHARRALKESDPAVLRYMTNLAAIYTQQGKWRQAEELGLECLQRSISTLGENHLETLTCKAHLASTYSASSQGARARSLQEELIRQAQQQLTRDHRFTLIAIQNLATIYLRAQGYGAAERLQKHALERYRQGLGESHHDTLTAKHNLAVIYIGQNRLKEADELLSHVVDKRRSLLGRDHVDTLRSRHSQALLWYKQGKVAGAVDSLDEVLAHQTGILGADHPEVRANKKQVETWRSQSSLQRLVHVSTCVVKKVSRITK